MMALSLSTTGTGGDGWPLHTDLIGALRRQAGPLHPAVALRITPPESVRGGAQAGRACLPLALGG